MYRLHPIRYDDGQLSRRVSCFERSEACSCLLIDPVKLVIAALHSDAIHSRHRRTELDGNRLLPVCTGYIRFGTMMDDYCKVSMAFKGRWSGSCSQLVLRIGIFKTFSSGSNSGIYANFSSINVTY
jgi:hypothetical protein